MIITDVGICIEIIGFILLLKYWKDPRDFHLKRWDNFIIKIKIEKFFKQKTYWKEISPDTNLAWKSRPDYNGPKVPKYFKVYWIFFRFFGLTLILVGLFLQFRWLN